MYGTQTMEQAVKMHFMFENDVKMYGTQTPIRPAKDLLRFENDVKMLVLKQILSYFYRTFV